MPLISVIMSVYNEPESILRAAVESILKQTFRDFEFIIVMDSPENETNKSVLAEYAKADDRLNLLFNEKNEGLTFSLNRALQYAKGMYIARMDADDVSLPLRLELQKDWLEKNYEKSLDKTIIYDVVDNAPIYILGDLYIIRIISSDFNRIERDGGFLNIYTTDISYEKVSRQFHKWLSHLTETTYSEILSDFMNLLDVDIEKLRIKKLTATYGICYTKRKEIVLSSQLIHKPYKFIEAVVLHELTHLKYPNHQKEFYDEIAKFMPDYKERLKHYTNVK